MRHTKDSLTLELEQAQRGGSPNEIADLRILLGSTPGDVAKARNRQAQRRHNRTRQSAPSAPTGAARGPRIDDWMTMTDSTGKLHGPWQVTKVEAGTIWCGTVPIAKENFSSGRAKIVDGQAQAPSEPEPEPITKAPNMAVLDACDAFYHAVRDGSDTRTWEAIDDACEAYELALAALGV